ncbi:MAG: hypothetical protein ACRERE_44915 [Candidatus Entotheonellia bacterium]
MTPGVQVTVHQASSDAAQLQAWRWLWARLLTGGGLEQLDAFSKPEAETTKPGES